MKQLSYILLTAIIRSLAYYVDYNSSIDCQLGTTKFDPDCATWTVLSAIVFTTVQPKKTKKVVDFIGNVTYDCNDNSYMKIYLPGCSGQNTNQTLVPVSRENNEELAQMGPTSTPLLLGSITETEAAVSNGSNASFVLNDIITKMTQLAHKRVNITDAAIAYLFTDLPCAAVHGSMNWNEFVLKMWQDGFHVMMVLLNDSVDCLQNDQYLQVQTIQGLPASASYTTCSKGSPPNYEYDESPNVTWSTSPGPAITTPKHGSPPFSALELGLIIGIPSLALVLLFAICACCCCKCMEIKRMQMNLFSDPDRMRKFFMKFKEGMKEEHLKHHPSGAPMDPCEGTPGVPNFAVSNHYMDIEQLATRNKKDDWEFIPKNLLINDTEQLGAGAFCTVYKCLIIGKVPLLKAVGGASTSLENLEGRTEGAVKRLPAHADEQNRKDFFHEMEFMKRLGFHVHCIAMLGCVSDMWDPLIVVEYCHYGDLLRFVRTHRNDFFGNGNSAGSDKSVSLTVKQLVSFAWQISDGMIYLAGKGFVHRDLAARNVLLTKNFVVKISDFGLCRYTDSALYSSRGGKVPIKWLSPEALKFGEYSVKSDVWSYGILLWELFSLGETPYNVVQSTDMLIHLETGNRLPQPQFCPNEIFKIASSTWEDDKDKRPTFEEIRAQLTLMLNLNDESYGYLIVVKKELEMSSCNIEVTTKF